MAAYHSEFITDLASPPILRPISHQFVIGDKNAYTFTALVCDTANPEAALLSGTVSGSLLRPDGSTVPLEGEKGDAVVQVRLGETVCNATPCSVTLPSACFAYPGRVILTIKLVDSGDDSETQVLVVSGIVNRTSTDAIVDPGEIIPDVETLMSAAQEALDAAADATAAAAYSVRYDTAQSKTDVEKAQAQANMGVDTDLKIVDALAKNNSWNRVPVYGDFTTTTNRGVTFTWNSDHTVCTLNCSSSPSSDATDRYLFSQTDLRGLEIGKTYLFNVNRSKANTGVDLYFYINGSLGPRVGRFSEPTYVTVPANATGILSRVYALAGVGVLTNATVSVEILDSHSNAWLEDQLTARTPVANCYLTPSGDTTDRASEIEAILTASGNCTLAPGEYYVSNITMPDETVLKGSGAGNTKLIMISGETGACVSLGSKCDVSDLSLYGQNSDAFTENAERHAIGWVGTFVSESNPGTCPVQGMVSNLYIEGFKGAAIYCNATSMQTHSGIQVNNVTAFKCWAGVYIKKYSEFSQFTNFRANYCTYGCINNGGNNIFTNCNFSRTGTCLLMDDTDSQSPNNSHGSYVGCVFDHSGTNGSGYDSNKGYSIILIGLDSGEMFTGCQIFYGRTKITDCVGIRFVGCNYGRRTNLEITNSLAIGFDSCVFRSNTDDDGTVLTASGNTGLAFNNCLQYDGSAFNPV